MNERPGGTADSLILFESLSEKPADARHSQYRKTGSRMLGCVLRHTARPTKSVENAASSSEPTHKSDTFCGRAALTAGMTYKLKAAGEFAGNEQIPNR